MNSHDGYCQCNCSVCPRREGLFSSAGRRMGGFGVGLKRLSLARQEGLAILIRHSKSDSLIRIRQPQAPLGAVTIIHLKTQASSAPA